MGLQQKGRTIRPLVLLPRQRLLEEPPRGVEHGISLRKNVYQQPVLFASHFHLPREALPGETLTWNDANRLNCGDSALKMPVPNGEPSLSVLGYASVSDLTVLALAVGAQMVER